MQPTRKTITLRTGDARSRAFAANFVVVNDIPALQGLSLTPGDIQTKAELALRGYGIAVATKPKHLLHIGITVLKANPPAPLFAYNVSVAVREPLRVPRAGQFVLSSVWELQELGLAGSEVVQDSTTKAVVNLVEVLVNDHLAVNPKASR